MEFILENYNIENKENVILVIKNLYNKKIEFSFSIKDNKIEYEKTVSYDNDSNSSKRKFLNFKEVEEVANISKLLNRQLCKM